MGDAPGVVDLSGVELDLDDLPALCAMRRRTRVGRRGEGSRAYVSGRNGWSGGGRGTHGIVDVGADDEALSPAVGVLDGHNVARLATEGEKNTTR